MPSEGKLEGENARKHKLLSINKTPNNTSSLHQMSGFFACARAVLYFFSCALYFETAALLCSTMTTTTMGGERKPCLPFKERIFLPHQRMLFFFFFALCEIFSKIFFVRDKEREQNSRSPLLLSLSSHAFNNNNEKNSKTRKELERERKPKSFLFPTTTSYISLSSARERWKR